MLTKCDCCLKEINHKDTHSYLIADDCKNIELPLCKGCYNTKAYLDDGKNIPFCCIKCDTSLISIKGKFMLEICENTDTEQIVCYSCLYLNNIWGDGIDYTSFLAD